MNSNKKKMVVILIAGGIVFFRLGKLLPSTQEQQPSISSQTVLDAGALVVRTQRQLKETEALIADAELSLQNALPADPVEAGLLLRQRVCDISREAGLGTPRFLSEPSLDTFAESDLLTLSFECSVEGPLASCLHFLELAESLPEVSAIAFGRLTALTMQQGDPLTLELRLESIVSELSQEEVLLSSYETTQGNPPVSTYHQSLDKLMMPDARPVVVRKTAPAKPVKPTARPPRKAAPPPPPTPPAFVLIGTLKEKNSGQALFYDQSKRKSIVVRQGEKFKADKFEAKMLLVKHRSVFLKMRGGTQEIQLSQSLKTIPKTVWLPE